MAVSHPTPRRNRQNLKKTLTKTGFQLFSFKAPQPPTTQAFLRFVGGEAAPLQEITPKREESGTPHTGRSKIVLSVEVRVGLGKKKVCWLGSLFYFLKVGFLKTKQFRDHGASNFMSLGSWWWGFIVKEC